MTEQELLEKIKISAKQVEIPDSIKPENISKKLSSAPKTRWHFSPRKVIPAAAIVLFCCMVSAAFFRTNQVLPDASAPESISGKAGKETAKETTVSKNEPKKNAGTLYQTAKSYDQIYELLESSSTMMEKQAADLGFFSMDTAEATAESSGADGALATNGVETASDKGYSTTNLQTNGVDESDFTKTDGRYIYTVTGSKIQITDTAYGQLKLAGSIIPDMNASDSILEFYVESGKLFLLIQSYDTTMEEMETETDISEETDALASPYTNDMSIYHSVETKASTLLCTYDVTDPASPKLTETFRQDGYYNTSRKIKDMIYLFTQKSLFYPSVAKGNPDDVIPYVNGEKIPYDHIYLPEKGNEGLMISSVNVQDLSKPVDKTMIIHNYVTVYVGNNAIYLYQSEYENGTSITQIAKFSIDNGLIQAVDAVSVKGEIYDTFAIHEYENNLRVLTTSIDQNGEQSNHLSLFDKDLKLTGMLLDLAKGEQIYAARYFENTAYFITYRNTDPLFVADLTDASNPKLLGELEITGFSEYLHLWGDDNLFGLGYETDPESGESKGLKLVLFQISNPTDLKIADSLNLPEYSYSPALYEYKCVLADPLKNLIGFTAEKDYKNEFEKDYQVFSIENGKFVQKLKVSLPDYSNSYNIRGMYIGNTFYLVSSLEIISYDMQNNFQELKRQQIS